ncbi:hypothetical protein [Actinoallomurus sp. CA-150999]|uniref:hypothetical protein n=1 Tax=Actinoallomurus sp. CA-150999 TaxID=3239887 RepID=UPI003D942D2C
MAFAIMVTGCSSSKPSSPGITQQPPATAKQPAASSSPSSPAGGSGNVPTGTKLKTLAPTAKDLPHGWKLDNAGNFDTGATVKTPSAPLLPGESCAKAMTNGGAKTLTDDYQASYAEQGLKTPNDTSSDLVFNGYQPGDAVKQMTEVSALAKRCAHFTTQALGGKTVKMTTKSTALAHLGDQALDVKVTPTGPYVADEIILVRSGNVIMAMDADSQSGPMPALKPLATRLAKRLPLKS